MNASGLMAEEKKNEDPQRRDQIGSWGYSWRRHPHRQVLTILLVQRFLDFQERRANATEAVEGNTKQAT